MCAPQILGRKRVIFARADFEGERSGQALGARSGGQVGVEAVVIPRKEINRILGLLPDAFGPGVARRFSATVIEAGVRGSRHRTCTTAVLKKKANPQNAVRTQAREIFLWWTYGLASGRNRRGVCIDDLYGQRTPLLAAYGNIGSLDRPPH